MSQQPQDRARLLFVDDEPRVLSSMRALFRRDYHVLLANSGAEALEILDREDIDVIVSDQRMPGMTGVDVLSLCRDRAPRAMRILLTGYADQQAIADSINEGEVFRYLTKPCAPDLLRETVALAARAAAQSTNGVARPAAAPAAASPAAASPAAASPAATASQPAVDAAVPAPQPGPSAPAPASPLTNAPSPAAPAQPPAVDLLVLSRDPEFIPALEGALGLAYRVHAVDTVEAAVAVLEAHPVGVLITDIALESRAVLALTTELKHHVPELVTVVASDHSDAHQLIELINGGQVFRFLLKPIKPRQTAIWIESAVARHLALTHNPQLAARHAVPAPSKPLLRLGGRLLRSLTDRLRWRRAPRSGLETS